MRKTKQALVAQVKKRKEREEGSPRKFKKQCHKKDIVMSLLGRDMIIFITVIIHFFHMYICVFHLLNDLFEEFDDKMV
jgi:hypothetical protein